MILTVVGTCSYRIVHIKLDLNSTYKTSTETRYDRAEGCGAHFPFKLYIENTSICGAILTEYPLGSLQISYSQHTKKIPTLLSRMKEKKRGRMGKLPWVGLW